MYQITKGILDKPEKVVLYGPEGVGKSSFASNFPNAVFIDTEGSTKNLDVARLPNPSSWTMLLNQIQFVKSNSHLMNTLVIDTVDWAEALCIDHICAQHNKKGIEDFGYGNGYVYVKEEFGRFLNALSDLIDVGIHVVLTAHSQIVKFEQPDEMGAYDRYQLKLGKKTSSQTAPLVKEWADMVLFMNYKTVSVKADDNPKNKKHKGQGGRRMIYANHHPAWDAKNRHGLPDEFPLEFNQIAHIFYPTGPAAETTQQPTQPTANVQQPVQPPTPQQEVSAPVKETATQQQTQQQQAPPTTEPPQQVSQPPMQTETPDPFPQQEPVQEQTQTEVSPEIHKPLRDLMMQHNVTEIEIQNVVAARGYYPADTPINNYDIGFIDGVLVGAWQQVFAMIEEARLELPFD